MSFRMIPLENYPRAEHFRYFCGLEFPFVGVGTSLDITAFTAARKQWEDPFFLTFQYCVGRAANTLPSFRQRILDGQIAEYDHCSCSYILLLPDQTYVYAETDTEQSFGDYLASAAAARSRAEKKHTLEDEAADPQSLFYISCMPWLSFSSLNVAMESRVDSIPRFSWGKAEEQNGRILLPFHVQAHHALVDGWHIGQLFEGIEQNMKAYVADRFGCAR